MIREASSSAAERIEGGSVDVVIGMAAVKPEIEVAREILSFLPEEIILSEESDRGVVRYHVSDSMDGWKLREIVFSRKSLLRLIDDPNRDVKISYMRREIERAAPSRTQWLFPRLPMSEMLGAQLPASR
ncbi:MAG: hypothetical protein KY459_13290 [Acidobacteria bacterium]|nr:hypothetical protein [Acidobacteriota bacterium]